MDDEERNIENIDKNSSLDEFMLPGFRFHPTDEELVGFYLRRKVEHKPLSIEIIKQIDIYKYDPWDLPKLAITGEKEWYFYCPRDRKYRNSTRPNRVTGAGFWKATGTDRPIYSSQGSKCIGLKKSLVFYKGRAAKGTKTDWMMHEFRLPSVSAKKHLEKINIPENEAWAICKIFKKSNSSTRRSLSNSWISPAIFDNTTVCNTINPAAANNFYFINSSNSTMANNNFRNDIEQQSSTSSFSHMQYLPPPINPFHNLLQNKPCQDLTSSKCAINDDASSLLLDMSSSMFGGFAEGSENQLDFSNISENVCQAEVVIKDQLGIIRSMGYGCNSSFPLMSLGDYVWKPNLLWDSSSPCPSDQLSTSYSANKGCT